MYVHVKACIPGNSESKEIGNKGKKKNAESNKGRPNLAAEYGVSGFSVNRRFQGREGEDTN